jgi:hypothetical protein
MDSYYHLTPCLTSECASGNEADCIHIHTLRNPQIPFSVVCPLRCGEFSRQKAKEPPVPGKVSASGIQPGERISISDFTLLYQHNLFLTQSKI